VITRELYVPENYSWVILLRDFKTMVQETLCILIN